MGGAAGTRLRRRLALKNHAGSPWTIISWLQGQICDFFVHSGRSMFKSKIFWATPFTMPSVMQWIIHTTKYSITCFFTMSDHIQQRVHYKWNNIFNISILVVWLHLNQNQRPRSHSQEVWLRCMVLMRRNWILIQNMFEYCEGGTLFWRVISAALK